MKECLVQWVMPVSLDMEKLNKATTVFRLKVLDMIGKRRNNIHPEEKTKKHVTLE